MANTSKEMMGLWYPAHHLVAIIDDDLEMEAAVAELEGLGYTGEDLDVYRGAEATEAIDARGEHKGPIKRLARFLGSAMTEEGVYAKEYQAAGEQGATILAVHAEDDAQIAEVHGLLRRHGAHTMKYFDEMAIRELSATDVEPADDHPG